MKLGCHSLWGSFSIRIFRWYWVTAGEELYNWVSNFGWRRLSLSHSQWWSWWWSGGLSAAVSSVSFYTELSPLTESSVQQPRLTAADCSCSLTHCSSLSCLNTVIAQNTVNMKGLWLSLSVCVCHYLLTRPDQNVKLWFAMWLKLSCCSI